MANQPSHPEICPYVAVLHGQARTTSLKVAEHFGKQHKNVVRAIRNLDCSDEFRRLNFEPSYYINEQGKKQPLFEMSKDGFIFLAMGLTGQDAARLKEAYISEFNRMETELRQPARPAPGLPAPDFAPIRTRLMLILENGQVVDSSVPPPTACVVDPAKAANVATFFREHVPTEQFPQIIQVGIDRLTRLAADSPDHFHAVWWDVAQILLAMPASLMPEAMRLITMRMADAAKLPAARISNWSEPKK
jgi:Rha family phage regulatory protein